MLLGFSPMLRMCSCVTLDEVVVQSVLQFGHRAQRQMCLAFFDLPMGLGRHQHRLGLHDVQRVGLEFIPGTCFGPRNLRQLAFVEHPAQVTLAEAAVLRRWPAVTGLPAPWHRGCGPHFWWSPELTSREGSTWHSTAALYELWITCSESCCAQISSSSPPGCNKST